VRPGAEAAAVDRSDPGELPTDLTITEEGIRATIAAGTTGVGGGVMILTTSANGATTVGVTTATPELPTLTRGVVAGQSRIVGVLETADGAASATGRVVAIPPPRRVELGRSGDGHGARIPGATAAAGRPLISALEHATSVGRRGILPGSAQRR